MIEEVIIANYKSIRNLELPLQKLNVLIGSNGVGKSNLISFFELAKAMIEQRFGSYTLEKGMGPKGMNSFNHYAYGCVCEWIWECAAGISSVVEQPGFKHIAMAPIPDKRLGYIKAEYNSAAGLIKSAWKYEGDKWIWEFTIPEGATASVTIPGEDKPELYQSGTYTIARAGL